MNSLFNISGQSQRRLSRMADLAVLNIIWLITCIPVVTIGGANIAMYMVLIEIDEHNVGSIVKDYLSFFKADFLPGLIIEFFVAAVGGIIVFDYTVISGRMETQGAGWMVYACFYAAVILVVMVWLLMYVIAFPIYARFECSTLGALLHSMLMGVSNLKYAFPAVLTEIFPVLLFLLFGKASVYFAVVWMIIGIAAVRSFSLKLLNRFFVTYID